MKKDKKEIRMRTTIELLQLVLDNIERAFNDENSVNDGICFISDYLYCELDIISDSEYFEIDEYLKENLPKRNDMGYCWPSGVLEPRIDWLKKQIENYEDDC